MSQAGVQVGVLGPVRVVRDGEEVELARPKWRALVAALALSQGRPVSVDAIADLIWGDAPPAGLAGALQVFVSGLRKLLEPARERRAPATVLVTVAPGYALRLGDDGLDAAVFEHVVDEQHRRLRLLSAPGPAVLSEDELRDAVAQLEGALGLWRGEAYAELGDAPSAVAERARLEELRLVALEDHALAELALGHHQTVAADLESLTAAHPLRERLWALRATALARSGRQADALEALARVREVLDEELGLEPGAELRDLQTAILRQDPSLDWTPPPSRPTTPVVVTAARHEPAPVLGAPSPLVGRDEDLAAALGALEAAAAGTPSYVALTGEPGIGKSRLAAELMAHARERGIRVALGRCTQDEGAPPLHPWAQVLRELGASLPAPEGQGEGAEFRAREEVVAAVLAAAADGPLLVGLDDLHWADPQSLRVLRLLVTQAQSGRLLVLATWREHPEPTGALADVVEAMARAHAVRRRLRGLDPSAVAEVFETVSGHRPSTDQAEALRERTDGNPFFLVEYARLAGERTEVADLVADAPPAGVQDVLGRRIGRLPEETVSALRAAAVLGRRFEAPVLARVAGVDEDDLLDVVEPAEAAGLVRDDGIERFVFAHALVRDTLLAGLGATRRARLHARAAQALDGDPSRVTEQAWHWLSAGPAYSSRAWRAAVSGSEVTRRLFAHEETASLLTAALTAMDDDPAATPAERYDVVMMLIDAYRWAGLGDELTTAVERAVALADELGDPVRLARAAIAPTQGVLWRASSHGLHEGVVGALRRSLDALGADDPLRGRVLAALANETSEFVPLAERQSLIDEALALGDRLGDDELLLDVCQAGYVSVWSPHTARTRLAYADRSLELARRLGQERAEVVSVCLRAVALAEVGSVAEMWETVARARELVQERRLPYGSLVIEALAVPWLAMAGRDEECVESRERVASLVGLVTHHQVESAQSAGALSLAMWGEHAREVVEEFRELDGLPFSAAALVVVLLSRIGDVDGAREHASTHPIEVGGDTPYTTFDLALCSEAALVLGDAALGSTAYSLLEPLAGQCAFGGSSVAIGPVDAFLACAAAASGRVDDAARHADDAERLCKEWEVPVVAAWLAGVRERYGF